jgi:hypothetical protein
MLNFDHDLENIRILSQSYPFTDVLSYPFLSFHGWDIQRSGTVNYHIVQAELLKLQKNGQFPDEPVRIKVWQIHYVTSRTY